MTHFLIAPHWGWALNRYNISASESPQNTAAIPFSLKEAVGQVGWYDNQVHTGKWLHESLYLGRGWFGWGVVFSHGRARMYVIMCKPVVFLLRLFLKLPSMAPKEAMLLWMIFPSLLFTATIRQVSPASSSSLGMCLPHQMPRVGTCFELSLISSPFVLPYL